jgi:hypothetical protein
MADRCPICGENIATGETGSVGGALMMKQQCPNCGNWRALLDSVVPDFGHSVNAALMPFLAAHIRQKNIAGERVVELTDDWARHAEAHAHTPIPRRLDLLLRWYESKSSYAGEWVVLEGSLYPLVDARNQNEVSFLNDTLVDHGLLEKRPNKPLTDFRITAGGWERLYPSAVAGVPGACFVAMSFAPELNNAYDLGIHPAVRDDCGFDDIRLDRVEHAENINDRIIADIRRAQFLVADFTFHPAGVYFEAGLGYGLGKLVIWTCRKDQFADHVHFDTRPFNHILWEHEHELRSKLANRVRALVPNAKSA